MTTIPSDMRNGGPHYRRRGDQLMVEDGKSKIGEMLYQNQFSIIIVVSEILFLVLFGCFADYGSQAGFPVGATNSSGSANTLKDYYAMFQDVHVMIFVGFGFLMTFLKKYAYSAVGFNFLLAAYSIQWALLFRGFMHMAKDSLATSITFEITQLINADFCAGAVLISMGALLGTLSAPQYILLAFFEVVFYCINEFILVELFQVADIGGSMIIHVFGAYFGLACSRVLFTRNALNNEKEKASYFDDLFSMIGTLFLWMYWPSFNAVMSQSESGQSEHRAVINTYLSLIACCTTAFALSSFVDHGKKLDMAHIQNATLAGGVAVGATANLYLTPCGAMIVGTIAGCISVFGYKYGTPLLRDKLKIHDTCGVHNLHGLPGVFGAVVGIIMAAIATQKAYGASLYEFYPGRKQEVLSDAPWYAGTQAAYQLAGLATTLAFALFGGTLTGILLKLPCWMTLEAEEYFDDKHYWNVQADRITPAVTPGRRRSFDQIPTKLMELKFDEKGEFIA